MSMLFNDDSFSLNDNTSWDDTPLGGFHGDDYNTDNVSEDTPLGGFHGDDYNIPFGTDKEQWYIFGRGRGWLSKRSNKDVWITTRDVEDVMVFDTINECLEHMRLWDMSSEYRMTNVGPKGIE